MGVLANLFGFFASGVSAKGGKTAATAVAEVIDELFTSEEEKLTKQAMLARISLKADELQAQINTSEAKHRSLFVAGWRPFIGWICGLALVWHFIALPILIYGGLFFGLETTPPAFDLGELNTILFGLLGLGTLRTFEKATGKTA